MYVADDAAPRAARPDAAAGQEHCRTFPQARPRHGRRHFAARLHSVLRRLGRGGEPHGSAAAVCARAPTTRRRRRVQPSPSHSPDPANRRRSLLFPDEPSVMGAFPVPLTPRAASLVLQPPWCGAHAAVHVCRRAVRPGFAIAVHTYADACAPRHLPLWRRAHVLPACRGETAGGRQDLICAAHRELTPHALCSPTQRESIDTTPNATRVHRRMNSLISELKGMKAPDSDIAAGTRAPCVSTLDGAFFSANLTRPHVSGAVRAGRHHRRRRPAGVSATHGLLC
jgi:hypothetical protein